MSAIGERGASPRTPTAVTASTGFTLIEMLVVLGIAGLISGLAFPRLQTMTRGAEYRSAVATAATMLRDARARALRTDAPQRLRVADDGPGKGGQRLGFANTVERLPASTRVAVEPDTGILFQSDGSSSGGALRVTGAGRATRFVVAPATGLAAPAAP